MYHQTQYLTVRNHVYYFNRNVPLELQSKLNKKRIIISLNTKSLTTPKYLTVKVTKSEKRESVFSLSFCIGSVPFEQIILSPNCVKLQKSLEPSVVLEL